jgi:hypothetical protein
MKILCCGDSWTNGFGVKKDKAWPAILKKLTGHEIDVMARNGAANKDIRDAYFSIKDRVKYDLVIFCWSGVTRNRVGNYLLEFSPPPNDEFGKLERINYFKDKSLNDLIEAWQNYMDEMDSIDDVKKIHFSVFGDQPNTIKENFYNNSFLELLAEHQASKFKYSIPIFEFGWLSNDNYDLVGQFAKSYFPTNWQRAIIERENVKPGKYFLSCGHPNERGHKLWAKHLASII